jgi:hypothetical protein
MVGDRLAALHPETTTPAAPAAETEEDWLS